MNNKQVVLDQILRKMTDLMKMLGQIIAIIIIAFLPNMRIYQILLIFWAVSSTFWLIGWLSGIYLIDKKK